MSKKEVNTLLKDASIYKKHHTGPAEVNRGNHQSQGSGEYHNIRKGTVSTPKEDFPNTYNIAHSILVQEYNNVFSSVNVDLTEVAEIQLAGYDVGDFFSTHKDTLIIGNESFRVITMSINLSDQDEYDGGEMEVYGVHRDDKNIYAVLNKQRGSYVIFPAMMYHQAKKVIRGHRDALVVWIHANETTLNKIRTELEGVYYNG